MKIKSVILAGIMMSGSIFAASSQRPPQRTNQGKAAIRAANQQRILQQRSKPPVAIKPRVVPPQPVQPVPQPVVAPQPPASIPQGVIPQPSPTAQHQPVVSKPSLQNTVGQASPVAPQSVPTDVQDGDEDGDMEPHDDSMPDLAVKQNIPPVILTPAQKQQFREHFQLLKSEIENGNSQALLLLNDLLGSPEITGLGISQSTLTRVKNAFQNKDLPAILNGIDGIIAEIPEIKRTWFQAIKSTAWNNSGIIATLASTLLLPPALNLVQGYVGNKMMTGISALGAWWSGRKNTDNAGSARDMYEDLLRVKGAPQRYLEQRRQQILSLPYQYPIQRPAVSPSLGAVDFNIPIPPKKSLYYPAHPTSEKQVIPSSSTR